MEKYAKEDKTTPPSLRRYCQWSPQLKNKCCQNIYSIALKKKKKTAESQGSMRFTKKH
jgi:hypothetical protein